MFFSALLSRRTIVFKINKNRNWLSATVPPIADYNIKKFNNLPNTFINFLVFKRIYILKSL